MDEKEKETQVVEVNLADEIVKEKQKSETLEAELTKEKKARLNAEAALLNTRFPQAEEKTFRPISELTKELNSGKLSNREYWKTALEIRESHMKDTGNDIFGSRRSDGMQLKTKETEYVAKTVTAILEQSKNDNDFNYLLDKALVYNESYE